MEFVINARFLFRIFFLLLVVDIFGKAPALPSPEESFGKLRKFVETIPSSFVAEVSSKEIEADIKKIPRIYIKNSDIKPKLLLYFSRDWGVKIWMDNVAKGIAKQYTALTEGFRILFLFLKSKTYKDFQDKFVLKVNAANVLEIRDSVNADNLFYIFQIDSKNGEIQTIKQKMGGKLQMAMRFAYRKIQGQILIDSLEVDRFDSDKRHYQFFINNYDIHPQLAREDFLG